MYIAKVAPCRHCQRELVIEYRGLCGTCVKKPEIRDQYPVKNQYLKRGELPLCPKCGEQTGISAKEIVSQKQCSICARPAFEREGYRIRIRLYEQLAAAGLALFCGPRRRPTIWELESA